MRKWSALVLVVAALHTSLCRADDLVTADGSSHSCEILSVDEDGVRAKGKLKSGEEIELKVPASRLDPHCFYALRDAAIGNDGKARLRLATWAVEQGMFAQAKAQVRKARESDPKLMEEIEAGKYPEIREGIATRVLASAEADMAAGRLAPAREKLNILLGKFPDTAAGGKSRDVLKALDAKDVEAEAKEEATAKAKLDDAARKISEANAKLMAAVEEDCTKGRTLATDGFSEDDVSKALDMLGKALNQGESALKKLDAIEKEHAADADLLAAAKERRKKVVAGMVRVRVHRADLYIWRSSLPNAKKELDAARALDPLNPEIDSCMARLLAADDDDPLELRETRERRQSGGSRFGGGGRGR